MTHTADASVVSENEPRALPVSERKPYAKPEIICELELETRAGSPIGLIDVLNPFQQHKL